MVRTIRQTVALGYTRMFSTVSVWVIAAFMTSECYGAFITVPVPQTAFVGQSVGFQCATNNASCTIQWMFVSPADITTMIYNGYDSKDGYSVAHSTSTPGSYNLIINHTSSSNAGSFACLEAGSCYGQQLHRAPLIVFDVESATNTTNQLVIGDVVLVSCRVLLYAPTFPTYSNVSVTIYGRAENVVANQSYQFIAENNMMSNSRTQTLSTNVGLAVTEPTFGPFYCEVRCLDSTPAISKRITVLQLQQVFYAVGAVDVSPSSGDLCAGDIVNCSASGYPKPTYFWERNLNNTWERIHNGLLLTLSTPGTYILRCTAFNILRNIPYSNTSRDVEFHVSETTGHTTIIRSSGSPTIFLERTFVYIGSTDSSTSTVAVGVGVGVGVGGGLLLIVLIVFLVIFCLRRKAEKAKPTETTLYEAPGFTNPAMPDPVYTPIDHTHPAGRSDGNAETGSRSNSDYLEPHITYQPLTIGHTQTNVEYETLHAHD